MSLFDNDALLPGGEGASQNGSSPAAAVLTDPVPAPPLDLGPAEAEPTDRRRHRLRDLRSHRRPEDAPVLEEVIEPTPRGDRGRLPNWKTPVGPIPARVPRSYLFWALWFVTMGRVQIAPSFREQSDGLIAEIIGFVKLFGGHKRIVIRSSKGGVGKTTASLLVAQVLKLVRWLSVVVVDGNPDWGTLANRIVRRDTERTLSDLVQAVTGAQINSVTDLQRFCSFPEVGAWVIGSSRNPREAEAITQTQFLEVQKILAKYTGVSLVDGGTGPSGNLAAESMRKASLAVVVTTPANDSLESAVFDLGWMLDHNPELTGSAMVLVQSCLDGSHGSERTDLDVIRRRLIASLGEVDGAFDNLLVVGIPKDPWLEPGHVVVPEKLRRETQLAVLRVVREIARRLVDAPSVVYPEK